jgi:hypothetical protein
MVQGISSSATGTSSLATAPSSLATIAHSSSVGLSYFAALTEAELILENRGIQRLGIFCGPDTVADTEGLENLLLTLAVFEKSDAIRWRKLPFST